MRGAPKLALALAVAALLATGLAACGDSGSDGSTATTGQERTAPTAAADGDDSTTTGDSSAGEGSAGFRVPGGDNSIQNFGDEADAAEVDAATAVLAGFLRARARNDWEGQCAYLAKATVAPLEQLASRSPRFKDKGCAAILAGLMAGTPPSTRADTLSGDIASLRVEDDRGFALYHGPGGVDYFVPLIEEDGEWKLGALAPNEFP